MVYMWSPGMYILQYKFKEKLSAFLFETASWQLQKNGNIINKECFNMLLGDYCKIQSQSL